MNGMERALLRAVRWTDRTAQRVSGGRWRVWNVAEALLLALAAFGFLLVLGTAGDMERALISEPAGVAKMLAGIGIMYGSLAGLKWMEGDADA